MARNPLESEESTSFYSRRRPAALVSRESFSREAESPCGRFTFPSIRAKAELLLARFTSRWDAFAEAALMEQSAIPANWQLLLHYLYVRGAVWSPVPVFPALRNDLPPLAMVSLTAPRTTEMPGLVHGFGADPDLETALSKAVGELLERSAVTMRPRTCTHASYASLSRKHGTKVLDIFSLNEFLDWQYDAFPKLKRSIDAQVAWVRATEIIHGKKVYIPAQLVFLRGHDDDEILLAQSTSNGSAGHFTRTEAIVSALGELIERDGFLIYWLNTISPKRIDTTTITDQKILGLLKQLRRYELEYHLLDTTTDIGVPSCIAVLIDRKSSEPLLAVGGGGGLDAATIITSALTEALSVLREEIDAARLVLPKAYTPFSDPKINRVERLHVWHGADMLEKFSFFIQGPLETFEAFAGDSWKYQTPEQQFTYLTERFRKMGEGYEIYVHEIESRVLKELGYHVVRAVVPRLVALHLRESMATLGASRLTSVPKVLGYTPIDTYNPWPHPFP